MAICLIFINFAFVKSQEKPALAVLPLQNLEAPAVEGEQAANEMKAEKKIKEKEAETKPKAMGRFSTEDQPKSDPTTSPRLFHAG